MHQYKDPTLKDSDSTVPDQSYNDFVTHYVNGESLSSEGRTLPVTNPATGQVIRHVMLADEEVVKRAVDAAQQAFQSWKEFTPTKRARVLFQFKQLLEDNADEITYLLTEEHGKTREDAKGELIRGIEVVEYACGIPELLKGEFTQHVGPKINSWSQFEPLGVVAGITPFNFPAMVPMWMYPIAIACGNTFVLKPSEVDPSAAKYCAELFYEAGLPKGVLNVVNGDKEAVDALLDHSQVQAVSFVGSTRVAQYIHQRASENHKRVQALGGAKNHALLMPDADIEQAVSATMGAAYGSCGERCMAISVVACVGEESTQKFIQGLQQAIDNLVIGNGMDDNVEMGPLVSATHREKVLNYIQYGIDEGAKLVVDGRSLSIQGLEDGYFLGPCLFDEVTPDMKIHQDEIFGPVLSIVRCDTQEAAMQLINEHPYGNGTCIFTRDGEAAQYFVENIKAGMVGVNVPLPVPAATHSFGGWKSSLFGDLYAYGPDAVRFYTRRKTITQRWPSGGIREAAQYAFPSENI